MSNQIEIERRFLCFPENTLQVQKWVGISPLSHRIIQGYIDNTADLPLRIREVDNGIHKAAYYCTLKLPRNGEGCTELESIIPASLGLELLAKCKWRVTKVRTTKYIKGHPGLKWEMDLILLGEKEVIITEIEVPSLDYQLKIPKALGIEITHIKELSNFNIAKDPRTAIGIIMDIWETGHVHVI